MEFKDMPLASLTGVEATRSVTRFVLNIFIFTLPFFQPGLWEISALAAFIMAYRASASGKTWKGLSAAFVYCVLYILVAIFVLPFIHTYTVIAWQWAPIWVLPLAAALISLIIFLHAGRQEWTSSKQTKAHLTNWGVAVLLVGLCWFNAHNKEVVDWSMAESLSPETMEQLPNSDMKNARVLPQVRGWDFAKIANHDRRLFVSMPHMAPCDSSGKQCWESAFHLKGLHDQPSIFYNFLGDTVFDVVTVDPTNKDNNSNRAEGFNGFFLAGPNSWVVKAAFAAHNPFSEQEEALFWRNDDGTIIMLIPYVSYKPSVSGVMVPYLAGVMSVDRFGLINDMWPSTAAKKYPNVPFFPTHLARKYAEMYASWNGGIQGRMVTQKDELRVSEPDVTKNPHFNQAPYVEVYEGGLGWQEVIALEPASNDSKALASILFFDASTGKCREYKVPKNITLNGPRAAMANSMQGNWNAQWPLNLKVEPRPIFRNGRIYYVVAVVTTEADEHPYVHSIVIDGNDMKPYPVLNHEELVNLIDKLDKGVVVTPQELPLTGPVSALHIN